MLHEGDPRPISQRDIADARHIDPLINAAVHVERALSADIEDVKCVERSRAPAIICRDYDEQIVGRGADQMIGRFFLAVDIS